jgi:hypothetical protein
MMTAGWVALKIDGRCATESNNGQAFAAGTAAVGEDFATTFGGLAGAKADLAGALLAMWAECRLHDVSKRVKGDRTLRRV